MIHLIFFKDSSIKKYEIEKIFLFIYLFIIT